MEDKAEDIESAVAADYLLKYVFILVSYVDWMFEEHLLLANILSAGILLSLGDLTVQTIEIFAHGRSNGYDFDRNGRTMMIGFALGVFDHYWYETLDHYYKGTTLNDILKKIALDQIVAGPFFSSAFLVVVSPFIYAWISNAIGLWGRPLRMGILEGRTARYIFREWRQKFISIYKIDWMFWPTAQFINFYLVPRKYRVFYVNVASFLWNTILSYKKHNHRFGYNVTRTVARPLASIATQLKQRPTQRSRKLAWSSLNKDNLNDTSSSRITSRSKNWLTKEKEPKPKDVKKERKAEIPYITTRRSSSKRRTKIKKKNLTEEKDTKILKKEIEITSLDLGDDFSDEHILAPTVSSQHDPELHRKVVELCDEMQAISTIMVKTNAVLEDNINEIKEDVHEMMTLYKAMYDMMEEGKRGVVNLALQIILAIRDEGVKGTEQTRRGVQQILTQLEINRNYMSRDNCHTEKTKVCIAEKESSAQQHFI